MADELKSIIEQIKQFNQDRDWDQYHNAKDLVIALMSEVGELAECYRWLNEKEVESVHKTPEKRAKIEDEIADIFMYLITLSYKTDINILEAVKAKMIKNSEKYPVKEIKGKHTNPIEGIKR